jgi:hypothetical protein
MMMLAKQSKTAKKYRSKMTFYKIHLRFSSLFQFLVFIGLNHNKKIQMEDFGMKVRQLERNETIQRQR